MPKEIIVTPNAPKSPFYSQGVKSRDLIFVSGQGAFDPTTGAVVGSTIQEQTAQCLKNIEAILSAGESSLVKLVSVTFIQAEESDFAGFNEEWSRWFPKDPPARQGAKLPIRVKDLKISIAAIAEG
jgi:2-iminobutanoate/2-iminopropanoate deaminase